MKGWRVGGAGWRRLDVLALSATLVAAAVTRLVGLDLMEFKTDEAEACRLALHVLGYSEPGVGRFFPTTGLTSSVGIPNPPLFVYLIALPLVVARTPLAAASFVATMNVVTIWLCYLVGKRYFSRFVGIASASLLALSPWGIVFSRKVSAVGMLPLFTTLFLLALHAFIVEKRPHAVFWLIILVAALTQLHFSAWILVLILVAALVLGRDALDWPWLALGAGGAIVLYAPFLWHVWTTHTAVVVRPYDGPDAIGRLMSSAHFMLAIAGADEMEFLVGSQSALAYPLSLLLGTAAFAGLLAACRHWRASPLGHARMLLVVWYLLPLAALTALPVLPYIHYFIILFPLPFLGLAYVLERLAKRKAALGWLALAGCLCSFVALDAQFFRTIVYYGGAPGGAPVDYGVAYRYKARAAAMFVRDNPGRNIEIGTDADFNPAEPTKEYRFLIWNTRPSAPAPTSPAAVGYVVVNTFHGTPPILASLPHLQSYPTKSYGHLKIFSIPLSS